MAEIAAFLRRKRHTKLLLHLQGIFAAIGDAESSRVKASWEASELGVAMKEYRYLQEAMSQTGVVMYSPYKVEF